MLLRFKTYKFKIPPKSGDVPVKNDIFFDAEEERKSVLNMLGIDSSLTDEELSEYKTSFSVDMMSILNEETEQVPVLDYIEQEISIKKSEIDRINLIMNTDYETNLQKWENGYEKVKTITLPNNDDEKTKLIESIESSQHFIDWVDEYEINEMVPVVENDAVELEAFKVGDIYVVCNKDKEGRSKGPEVKLLALDNSLSFSEVSVDDLPDTGDNVMTIYQFYEYIDGDKSGNKNTLIDMIVDRDQTEIENKNLIEVNDFFASKDTVEDFSTDDIFKKMGDIYYEN